MRLTRRRGWTLHEMLISLCVMSGVFAIVAHQALTQLRLYGGITRTTVAREHRAQAEAIAERLLWALSPGDIAVAQDSALQFDMQVGATVVCASAPGTVTVAAPSIGGGVVLSGFNYVPEPGDRLAALFHDSLGTTWLSFRLASAPLAMPCARFAVPGWQLALVESIALPEGAALRVLRPVRLSLYRASDSRWYLGAKEWNAPLNRFNSIQPVSGPYARYDPDPRRSGLAFIYADRAGLRLEAPVDASRIARISIFARPLDADSADAGATTIALRNVR